MIDQKEKTTWVRATNFCGIGHVIYDFFQKSNLELGVVFGCICLGPVGGGTPTLVIFLVLWTKNFVQYIPVMGMPNDRNGTPVAVFP